MTRISLNIGGKTSGPYTPEQIDAMLRAGEITRETFCAVEGHGIGWLPIWKYLGDGPADFSGSKKQGDELERDDMASEKQMEKMRFFGCTWEGALTWQKASDALDYCVQNFPEKEREWQNRPATPEQIRRLEEYGEEEIDPNLTYSEAKAMLQEWEIANAPEELQREEAELREMEIHIICDEMNEGYWDVYYRPVTLEEVKQAADYLDQNKPGWCRADVVDALQALFQDYRFNEALRGIAVRYCLPCRRRIDIPQAQLGQAIKCPHCGYVQVYS